MKKNLFYTGALLLGLTIATGCSNEESLEQNNMTVVEATIENPVARTTVSADYKVLWSTGDAFTVWESDNTKKGDMTLNAGGGTSTGTFGNSSITLADGDVALFPAVSGDAKTYTFKNSYTSTETDAPLYGTYNGTSFSFKHLAAFIRVSAVNLMANTSYALTITSETQTLTGEATLAENNALVPTGTGKQITVTLISDTNGSLTFDAPIPAQDYTKITLELKTGDTQIVKKERALNAEVGHLYELNTTYVSDFSSLKTALQEDGAVTLTSEVTLSEGLSISENTAINLNGQTLNTGANTISVAEGKTLTILNSSDVTARTATNPTITGSGDIITAGNNSTITIGEGVNITNTAENCCIFVPSGANNVIINTAGNLYTQGKDGVTNYAAIYVNGNVTSGTINITGGSVKHEKDVAVYIAGKADLNISGGEITGTTGVEIRGGALTINGGTITATGTPATANPNGNGTTTVGSAVAISQHTTNYPITATINGGTFVGENALYEADLHANDQKATGVTMSVTDGTFKGKVSSQSCANFITGGTFSDVSVFNYLASNANVSVNLTSDVTVGDNDKLTIPAGATVALDLNGKTISQTSAAPISMLTNNGTLTINDTNSNGKISFTYTGSAGTDKAANAISNNGALTVVGGTITNNSVDGRVGYAIDNLTGSSCNVDGGNISATGSYCDGIRLFCGASKETTVIVNGGTISTVWAQNPSNNKANEVKGTVIINGGTINTTYYENYTTVKVKTGVTTTVTPYGAGSDNTTNATEGEYTVYSFVHSN